MLLDVTNLHTYYGQSHALNDVSFHIDEGEAVALLGRNGMGKSTTLQSLMGLIKPSAGNIRFGSRNVCGLSPHKIAKKGMAYVPEERRIFPSLSILDNLKMGIKGGKINSSDPSAWTFEKVFDYFPFMKERPQEKGGHLSGGEQQMLSIARALMGNPRLLLVDEPTEGLSPVMVETVKQILKDAHTSGIAILLVEHNFNMAMSVVDRVYLMGKGHIGYSGTVEELLADDHVRASFLEV